MKKLLAVIVTTAISGTLCIVNGQSPSLQETLGWMENTLRPQEGNAIYTLKPHFESQSNLDARIESYHTELISAFSHRDIKVTFTVIVADNDMGLLLGLCIVETQVETFDLSDIDPTTIKAVANDCLYCKQAASYL